MNISRRRAAKFLGRTVPKRRNHGERPNGVTFMGRWSNSATATSLRGTTGFHNLNCNAVESVAPIGWTLRVHILCWLESHTSRTLPYNATLPYNGNQLRVSSSDYILLFIRRELEGTSTECGILLIPHRDDTTYSRVSSHDHRSAQAIQEPVDGLNVRKFSRKINIWEACGRVV